MEGNDCNTPFKVIVIGNSNSGKSSLILRFVKGYFEEYLDATIGASFQSGSVVTPERTYRLSIWDTAGQERYRSIISMYYRNTDVCIIAGDLTDPASISDMEYWIRDFRKKCNNSGAKIFLVGNKLDLITSDGESESPGQKRIRQLAQKYEFPYGFTSAKQNYNITEIFLELTDGLTESYHTYRQRADLSSRHIHISPPKRRGWFSRC